MRVETVASVHTYFRDQVVDSLKAHQTNVTNETEYYLVNLLASYATRGSIDTLEQPLAFHLAEALSAPAAERVDRFRDLGDAALYVAGFFSDHLERRGVSQRYVATVGGRAYFSASQLARHSHRRAQLVRAHIYQELAERFDVLVQVLDDVRESTTMCTPQDLVRLYEKWQKTHSPKLAERLQEEGVFPQPPAEKDILH